MNWKRVISGVLAAAMLSALPVQLLVSAEGTEAVGQADGWEKLTTLEPLDECNAFFYSKDDQTFEKITHPEKDVKTADGIVDYLGDGAVAVVTDPEDAAYNAGDRGQNYAWSAVGYGDWLYVGTCYAAIGNTLSLMKSSLGDEYDDKVLAATFDALYNGTFFLTEEDGGRPKGVLVKINTKTGETKLLMSGSYNGYTPLFRNALEYHGKLYFCGSVGGGGIGFLPSIWQVDPATNVCKPVYIGLNSVQDYAAAYQQGISVGIRGMCVYKDQLVISNVTMDAATGKSSAALLISSDPEKGFTQIADSDSLFNYPAYHYADSIYGGSIWDMVEDNNSSLLAVVGSAVSFIFAPLGFGDWQSTVATVTGLIAKENVVSTFGVLFHVGEEVAEDDANLWSAVALHYTQLSAYSFMLFNLLCAPCFAAMGAIKREMNNGKWTLAAIGYMCVFAYAVSLITYQLGGLITGETAFGAGTVAALLVLAFLIYMLVRPNQYNADYKRGGAASGKLNGKINV